jgi:hypothetical protein
MGILSNLTVKPLLWACGILLALLLTACGALYVQAAAHDRDIAIAKAATSECETKLEATSTANQNLAAANAKQQAAVEDLVGKLDRAIGETERLDILLADAEARASAAHRERDRALAQVTELREKIYATDPSCAAWGAAPVCAAISDGVREGWNKARSAGWDGS